MAGLAVPSSLNVNGKHAGCDQQEAHLYVFQAHYNYLHVVSSGL